MVVLLVARLERGQDLDRVLDARLLDIDGLEATLEGRVLGEVLAEFLGRGGADNLEGTAREHGLEHRARVDGALSRTGTDDGVHLVDKQDDVVGFGGLLDHVLRRSSNSPRYLAPATRPGRSSVQIFWFMRFSGTLPAAIC